MKRVIVIVAVVLLILFNLRSWGNTVETMLHMPDAGPAGLPRLANELHNSLAANGYITQDVGMVKNQVDTGIANFQNSRDYSETSIHQLLAVLSCELSLVNHLSRGDSPLWVAQAYDRLQEELTHAIPSVLYLYDAIMNLATYTTKIKKNSCDRFATNRKNKQEFLYNMHETLEYYHALFGNLQLEISIVRGKKNHTSLGQHIDVDRENSIVSFCPVRL